jgi:hypothetical protein
MLVNSINKFNSAIFKKIEALFGKKSLSVRTFFRTLSVKKRNEKHRQFIKIASEVIKCRIPIRHFFS